MVHRIRPSILAGGGAVLLLWVASVFGRSTQPAERQLQWVGSWGSAPQLVEPRNLPPAPGLSHNTLRQVVHLSCGGGWIRVRFCNAYGNGPVVIESAHVAFSDGGSRIRPDTDHALRFDGQASVTVPPGAPMWSDPLPLQVPAMADLAVTICFGAVPTAVTGHPGSRCTSYLQSGDAISAAELPAAATADHWYVLDGIDVAAAPDAATAAAADAPTAAGVAEPAAAPAAIVVLGDSITDGRGSGTNKNDRWPDDLERRLAGSGGAAAGLGVLNMGIGGNRLLNDGLGPSVLARFDRDVAAQTAARWLIVFEGVNDIGTGPKTGTQAMARSIIAAYQQIITRARTQHLKVYGATITPFDGSFYASPDRIAEWQTINDWIRSSGQFDAVIDFDLAMRDPQQPTHLRAEFDSGDHLHPSEAGYRHMAGAVDLALFKP